MKYIFYFGIGVFFFTSCIKDEPTIPPTLVVTPDTIKYISALKTAEYYVVSESNDILDKFSVETVPDIFLIDSILPALSHNFNKKVRIRLTGAQQDSLVGQEITVIFKIKSHYSDNKVVKTLKVLDQYPKLIVDSGELYFSKDSSFFYSLENQTKLNYIQITDNNFDLVYTYQTNFTFSLCSPDASYVTQALFDFSLSYYNSSKKHTDIARTMVTENQISPSFVYNYSISPEYIGNQENLGVGATNLSAGTVLAFMTSNYKKGFIIIKSIDPSSKKLTFKYYIQS